MNNLLVDIPAGQVELVKLSDSGNNLTEELSKVLVISPMFLVVITSKERK